VIANPETVSADDRRIHRLALRYASEAVCGPVGGGLDGPFNSRFCGVWFDSASLSPFKRATRFGPNDEYSPVLSVTITASRKYPPTPAQTAANRLSARDHTKRSSRFVGMRVN